MTRLHEMEIGDVLAEFDGESLGDARLDERLRRIVGLAGADPGQSFPEQMASVADPRHSAASRARFHRE